jgi:hypothetical protein
MRHYTSIAREEEVELASAFLSLIGECEASRSEHTADAILNFYQEQVRQGNQTALLSEAQSCIDKNDHTAAIALLNRACSARGRKYAYLCHYLLGKSLFSQSTSSPNVLTRHKPPWDEIVEHFKEVA